MGEKCIECDSDADLERTVEENSTQYKCLHCDECEFVVMKSFEDWIEARDILEENQKLLKKYPNSFSLRQSVRGWSKKTSDLKQIFDRDNIGSTIKKERSNNQLVQK